MSYLVKRRLRRGSVRPGMGMGGWPSVDDVEFALLGPAGYAAVSDPVAVFDPIGTIVAENTSNSVDDCITQANDKTAELDATIRALNKTWNPTGFYSPDQVTQLLAYGGGIAQHTLDSLGSAMSEFSGTSEILKEADTKMRRVAAESADFEAAIAEAKSNGFKVIESPGLRRWVLQVMSTASYATSALVVTSCLKPWFVSAYQKMVGLFSAAASFIATMAEVAFDLAKDAVLKIPDALSTAVTVIKFAAIGGLAWLIYSEYQKHKSRSA